MNSVKVRNLEIGSGMPKICVPIVGMTREEIYAAAQNIKLTPVDLVEWRVDWYQDVFNHSKVVETATKLREILENIPLLFTFRTANEGGEKAIDKNEYVRLNQNIIKTKLIDLVDVEVFSGDDVVTEIMAVAKEFGVKVVGSNHDFSKTPSQQEIVNRLKKMQALNIDLPKIAVMPQSVKDLLVLLSATEEFASNADRPIITMSMAGTGVLSRLAGEVFGSAVTFGAVGKVSAPGQMEINDLKTVLSLIHKSL